MASEYRRYTTADLRNTSNGEQFEDRRGIIWDRVTQYDYETGTAYYFLAQEAPPQRYLTCSQLARLLLRRLA